MFVPRAVHVARKPVARTSHSSSPTHALRLHSFRGDNSHSSTTTSGVKSRAPDEYGGGSGASPRQEGAATAVVAVGGDDPQPADVTAPPVVTGPSSEPSSSPLCRQVPPSSAAAAGSGSAASVPTAPAASGRGGANNSDSDEDEPVLSYSKQQRWPAAGEPTCVVCGRYGAYIVDRTEKDVCSLECKARHLALLAKERPWCYSEHVEVTRMTEDQVAALRKELVIDVKGERVPKPVTELHHLSLPERVQHNLQEAGYAALTPVQMQAMPAVLLGRDVLVSATTGSGKTLCFLLPSLLRLWEEAHQSPREAPKMVVLSPTRELCMQIEEQAKQLAKGLPFMKTALLVGGLPIANQLHRLRKGAQILVATPARLVDIITNHAEDMDLSSVTCLVLDEVDSLLHLGFELQVRQIEERLPRSPQYLMFSATIPPRIERLATDMMTNPLFISVGVPSAPCDAVRHRVLWVEEASKKKRLFAFLTDSTLFQPPAVIFVNSKMGTVLLADAINKMCEGVTAIALHGDMVQERRSAVLQGFLEGRHMCMVATGVLGRGLDLMNVTQVYNFDMPNSITDFIHQIGRAGRLGAPGWATTFINTENKGVFVDLVDVLEPMGVQLPHQLLSSPYLTLQREQRKRRQEARGDSRKRKTEKDFYNSDNLLALIKSASKRRR